MRTILEDVINEAIIRWNWEGLNRRAEFDTVATESQGKLTTLAGPDFVKINNGTLWDMTNRRPVIGPVLQPEWQMRKASQLSGPFHQYQVRGGELLLDPVPPAGHSYSFFWTSNKFVVGADLAVKSEFSADTDTTIFDDNFVYQGLLWGWKQEKGLPYAEDLRTWELMAIAASGASGTRKTLSMDQGRSDARPGILVPEGDWPLV